MIGYSLTHLSNLPENKLIKILKDEFGVSGHRTKSKSKMELIEMVCDEQDGAKKRCCGTGDCDDCQCGDDGCDGTPDGSGGCGGCSSHLSIANPKALELADPKPGTSCEIHVIGIGQIVSGNYVGPIRVTRGRVAGIQVNVRGLVKKFLWDEIFDAWIL